MHVSSHAFINGGAIPKKYTCDGQNVAPPLAWSDVPQSSRSLAVICDDPDAPAGTFTHWVLYDIPASLRQLSEGASVGTAGVNSFGKLGFSGPCPPRRDPAHHYHFQLYALDVDSIGVKGLPKKEAMEAMAGHILAKAELIGVYKRASA